VSGKDDIQNQSSNPKPSPQLHAEESSNYLQMSLFVVVANTKCVPFHSHETESRLFAAAATTASSSSSCKLLLLLLLLFLLLLLLLLLNKSLNLILPSYVANLQNQTHSSSQPTTTKEKFSSHQHLDCSILTRTIPSHQQIREPIHSFLSFSVPFPFPSRSSCAAS
jgi:hypothetical protein